MERSRFYKKNTSFGTTAENSYAIMKTHRNHHQKSYLTTNRPQYMKTKTDQEVYPNTFHNYHQQFKPGRKQIQKKYQLTALSKSVQDVRKQSDLLIPTNRKRKIVDHSYQTTNPILNESSFLHRSVSKERLWSQERKWRDSGVYSKITVQQWKY